MLTEKQIQEIRTALEESLNPLFFFDDDQDGIASYLLLKRKYQKGKGIPAKTRVGDDEFYLRKMKEYDPDLVVFLDRPVVSQEIIDAAKTKVVWIDHHDVSGEDYKDENIFVFNPIKNKKKSETYISPVKIAVLANYVVID